MLTVARLIGRSLPRRVVSKPRSCPTNVGERKRVSRGLLRREKKKDRPRAPLFSVGTALFNGSSIHFFEFAYIFDNHVEHVASLDKQFSVVFDLFFSRLVFSAKIASSLRVVNQEERSFVQIER